MSVSENNLLNTTDASRWAAAFLQRFSGVYPLDEGTMLAWFASAIETGRTAGQSQYRAELERVYAVLQNIANDTEEPSVIAACDAALEARL